MPSLLWSDCTPSCLSSLSVVPMSFRAGTFCKVMVSAVSRLAHKIGRAAFLAPEIVTSPARREPPVMWSLSIRVGLVFGWGQCTHRQCVDFGLHARSEEHTSELQSLMRISYAVFCLKKKNN